MGRTSTSPSKHAPKIRVPALAPIRLVSTPTSPAPSRAFLAACSEAAPEARDHQYLVAGPWQHIPWGQRIGSHDFGPAANLDTDNLHLRFFNHYLKGTGDFANEPRIRHFALNQSEWHTAGRLAHCKKLTATIRSHSEPIGPPRNKLSA